MRHRRRSILGAVTALVLVAPGAMATAEPSAGPPPARVAAAADFVDDNDPSVQYTGDWRRYVNDPYFAGGMRLSLVGAPNPTVTVSWTGGQAQVIGGTEHNNQVHGIADVTLDGQAVGTIYYSTPEQTHQHILFDTGELPDGDHTLTIRSRDEHGEHGTGIRISFDALVYGACLGDQIPVCDPPVLTGDDITDEEFFAALDLDHAGLAAVRTAVQAGDYDGAKQALADYYRAQDSRAVSLPGPSRPAPEPTYNTKIADDILAGQVWAGGHPNNDPVTAARLSHWYEVANAYWWTGDPTYATELGTWMSDYLSRVVAHDINVLTVALRPHPQIHAFYALQDAPYDVFTVDQRIDALKTLLAEARDLQWSHEHPDDRENFVANIRTIASNALTKIALTFPEFQESGVWQATGFDGIVRSVDDDLFPDGTGIEMSTGYSAAPLGTGLGGLYMADRFGAAPPAGLDLAKLEQAGWYWAYLLHPDGVQPMFGDGDANVISEQTFTGGTVYVDGGSITFADELPDEYADIVAAAPDGWYTRGMSPTDRVRMAAEVFDEPGMAAAVNHGPVDQLPPPSRAFTFSAQYFQRSGFDIDSRYLAFDAGPLGTGHSHQDKLGIDLYAYGRPLIADPGRYTYGTTGDLPYWQGWFDSTAAHSTIYVDDKLQHTPQPNVPTQPQPNTSWVSDSTFDDATGSYDVGYGSDRALKAVHDREVFFAKPDYWITTDRVSGVASGEVTSMFHFTDGTATVDQATQEVTFVGDPKANGDTAGVVVAPAGDGWDGVSVAKGAGSPTARGDAQYVQVKGWYAPVYGERRPAPQADYVRDGSLPMVNATVLYPFDGAQAPDVSATSLDIARSDGSTPPGEAVAVGITRPGGADVFVSAPADGVDRTFTGGSTDARRAFAARDTSGAVEEFVILDGSSFELDGTALVGSSTPIEHLSGAFHGSTLALEGTGLPASIRIAAPAAVTAATVNGQTVAVTRDGDHLVVHTTIDTSRCADADATVITGAYAAPLTVSGVTCLDHATVAGPVTVSSGGSLYTSAGTIDGPVRADDARSIVLAGTSVAGPVSISGADEVAIVHGDIGGPLALVGSGSADRPPLVTGSSISGPLSCSGNDPPPDGGSWITTVGGPASGQCAGW